MSTINQPLVSQQCIDFWRGLYARQAMIRRAPYWAWDRQGVRIPITDIIDTVRPQTILDYGAGNGRGAAILRTRDINGQLQVDCYDPAWPGYERVPTKSYDMVIAYNLLNNVEPSYLQTVCQHIESLVTKDLILAVVLPEEIAREPGFEYLWINKFPNLSVSYFSTGAIEETVGLSGKPLKFNTLFIWMYRPSEEIVPPQPRIRVKKKGT